MRIKNLSGTLQLNYQIKQKRYPEGNFAAVELYTALPGQEMQHVDTVAEIKYKSYADNLKAALIEAEERWGMDLIELETLTIE